MFENFLCAFKNILCISMRNILRILKRERSKHRATTVYTYHVKLHSVVVLCGYSVLTMSFLLKKIQTGCPPETLGQTNKYTVKTRE